MGLNKLPRVANILVFQDNFTKHVLAYVTPIKQLNCCQVPVSGLHLNLWGPSQAPEQLGVNFLSSIIDEMCMLLSMKKLQTMPYHPQANGLVERSHQTIIQVIRKLGEDKKANWPGHLAEIVHAMPPNPL